MNTTHSIRAHIKDGSMYMTYAPPNRKGRVRLVVRYHRDNSIILAIAGLLILYTLVSFIPLG